MVHRSPLTTGPRNLRLLPLATVRPTCFKVSWQALPLKAVPDLPHLLRSSHNHKACLVTVCPVRQVSTQRQDLLSMHPSEATVSLLPVSMVSF